MTLIALPPSTIEPELGASKIPPLRSSEIALPQVEQLGPCLFGSLRIEIRTGPEAIAVMRAGNGFERMASAGLLERGLELGNDVSGDRRIDLGEGVIELALDLAEP